MTVQRTEDGDTDALVEALIAASRALVAVAARSVAGLGTEVTLPQYRALVVLASRGPQRGVDLAAELGVNPSTATRLIDRLVRADLVDRRPLESDRRAVLVTLRPAGRRLVTTVNRRRRTEVARIVAALPRQVGAAAIPALRAFSEAAGEIPENQWWLGFEVADDDRAPSAS
jgi:DNA-binding MarR family transcriptional regulator